MRGTSPSTRRRTRGEVTPLFLAAAVCAGVIAIGAREPAGLYDSQARAFAAGQLHLLERPDPRRVVSANPTDAHNVPFPLLWDASLYKDRYYLYWGPVPALVRLPWTLLVPRPLHEAFVIWAYAIGCLALMRLLLRGAANRPGNGFVATLVFLVYGLALIPSVLSVPTVYLEAILAGHLCLLAALAAFAGYLRYGNAGSCIAVGSFLALAIGARISLLVYAPWICLAVFLVELRHRWTGWRVAGWRAALVAGPVFAMILALLTYNYARFDSPWESGTAYQINGKLRQVVAHSWAGGGRYVLRNLGSYLWGLPQLGSESSTGFAWRPFKAPAIDGWENTMPMSVFLFSPLLLVGWVEGLQGAWCMKRLNARPESAFSGSVFVGSVSALVVLSTLPGNNWRYVVDFMPAWLLLAGVRFLRVGTSGEASWAANALKPALIGVLVWSLLLLPGVLLNPSYFRYRIVAKARRLGVEPASLVRWSPADFDLPSEAPDPPSAPGFWSEWSGSDVIGETGRLEGARRYAEAGVHAPGWLIRGPFENLSPGAYTVTFRIATGPVAAGADVAKLVIDGLSGATETALAERVITGRDFRSPGFFEEFQLPVEVSRPIRRVEYRLYWPGHSNLVFDRVLVQRRDTQ